MLRSCGSESGSVHIDDPEPAEGRMNDFYGISFGMGIVFQNLALDIAYQYRFGRKWGDEHMMGQEISSNVKQNYLYFPIIFYYRRPKNLIIPGGRR